MPNIKGEYIVPVYTWSDDQTAIDKGYEELIRCKECRNLLTVAWIGDEAEPYAWMCDHWHMSTDPEGFCHKAKRRKDGNDQQGDTARPID